MGWFNRNIKKKVTRDELAGMLYCFANKFSVDYVPHEMAKENSPFKSADKDVFIHERLILIFWIIDAFFSYKEQKLMAAIHKKYFADKGIMKSPVDSKKEETFIMGRYKDYYGAYNKDAGSEQHLLGGVIAKNILQQDKPIMNILTTSMVAMDVMLLVKQLKESVFDKYEIVD